MQALHIDGNNLGLDEVRQVVQERRPVLLQPEARIAVERARAVVEELLENDGVAYAVNTGVGKLADLRISPDDIRKLQINLLRSHAAGVGEPLAEDVTRAMVLLRANSLAKGFSGVRPAVIDTLCEMLNRGVHPVIPSQGSVGASGDLAPAGASGAGADRRGRSHLPRQARSRCRGAEASRHCAAGAASQRGDLPHQWHAGHAGSRIVGHPAGQYTCRHRGCARGPHRGRAKRYRRRV